MTIHNLGQISLTLSALLYFVWFIPQLTLTFKRKDTSGLSFSMHSILMLGYIADLHYGFGQNFPIQYRLVTITGLISLLIEHYQFARFGLMTLRQKHHYITVSLVLFSCLVLVISDLAFKTESAGVYNIAGVVSLFCWLIFTAPQILTNAQNKSTEALSTKFVLLLVITGLLDTVATYALNWAWPSKLSTPIGLVLKLTLLWQCYSYRRRTLTLAVAI